MLEGVTSAAGAPDATTARRPWRRGRALTMLVGGVVLLGFALVHAVWTGWHAPLSAWVAPLGVLLTAGGAWSLVTRQRVPRWMTVLTVIAAVVLAGLLLWMVVIILTAEPSAL